MKRAALAIAAYLSARALVALMAPLWLAGHDTLAMLLLGR